jgi:hypothetical protein
VVEDGQALLQGGRAAGAVLAVAQQRGRVGEAQPLRSGQHVAGRDPAGTWTLPEHADIHGPGEMQRSLNQAVWDHEQAMAVVAGSWWSTWAMPTRFRRAPACPNPRNVDSKVKDLAIRQGLSTT